MVVVQNIHMTREIQFFYLPSITASLTDKKMIACDSIRYKQVREAL